MKLKSVFKLSAYVLCTLFTISACKKDDVGSDEIPVNITLSGRGNTGNIGGQTEDEIGTLRIIIVGNGSETIVYNTLLSEENSQEGLWSQTFNLQPGLYDFYMVANEQSIAYENINSPDIKISDLENHILEGNAADYTSNGIPFSEIKRKVRITKDTPSLGPIKMKRALSKICLSFKNETGTEQTITDMKIEGIKANEGYLFFHTEKGAATRFDDLVFSNPLKVPADANEENILHTEYIYPGTNPSITDCYYLTAKWNNNDQKIPIKDDSFDQIVGGYIPRNTQLNIVVTLKKNEGICAEVTCTVKEWESVPLGPSFE